MDLARLMIFVDKEDKIVIENGSFHYYIAFKDSKREAKVVIALSNDWIKNNIDKFIEILQEIKKEREIIKNKEKITPTEEFVLKMKANGFKIFYASGLILPKGWIIKTPDDREMFAKRLYELKEIFEKYR